MNYTDLIYETLFNLSWPLFDEAKNTLVDEYIKLSVLKKEELTPAALSEKICDFFEKVRLKTGKGFDQQVEEYIADLDAIVGDRIAKQKKGADPKTPRSRKYYERACSLKKSCTTKQRLIDYSRIMMCLYMSILANDFKPVTDFDYSSDCLNLYEILNAMRNEKTDLVVGIGKRSRFDTKEEYCIDRSSFVITVLMYYCIKSKEVTGEF